MKKKIPIALRKFFDKYSNYNDSLFEIEIGDEPLLIFTDVDINSGYYFQVKKINAGSNTNSGKTTYTLEYLPYNEETISKREATVVLTYIKEHFEKWVNILLEANKESPLFDDNITQAYFDEIGPKFKIIDEDANYKPFSIEQQKKILVFLDNAERVLKENPKQTSDVKESIELINETKKNINVSTKTKVINNIRKIVAKGFKIGLKVGEKLLIEFTTELTKKLLIG
ncbi:hypothetical protein [Gaetbulibacter sp. PBL-D1]|uniref:hypothetical protein n=1 Tax=Gaetbulibacter sp. PBL-D1 TaxID=3422594 RepID=UPI003D2EA491